MPKRELQRVLKWDVGGRWERRNGACRPVTAVGRDGHREGREFTKLCEFTKVGELVKLMNSCPSLPLQV